jgi:hypothetical protein
MKCVHTVCCLAGSLSYIDDLREGLRDRGVVHAIKNHDTAALFDWLIEIFSLQGISDAVASGYIAEHGNVRWSDVANGLSSSFRAATLVRFHSAPAALVRASCASRTTE